MGLGIRKCARMLSWVGGVGGGAGISIHTLFSPAFVLLKEKNKVFFFFYYLRAFGGNHFQSFL